MAYFIPSYIQKRLLRFALARTDLLDDTAINLDNLDITLGTRNVIELKDLGLNIKRLSLLLQLPPRLKLETARVLSLRLTIPADIYQSAIKIEVDGIEILLRLQDEEEKPKERRRTPASTKSPPHRKTNRRLRSPPPYDPGGDIGDGDDVYIPTTQDLAKSFLQEEPLEERKELEASVAARSNYNVEDSMISESSDDMELGTGAGLGLPGFLASFLQGIIDRLQVSVRNVRARLESQLSEDGQSPIPIAIGLNIAGLDVEGLATSADSGRVVETRPGNRHVAFRNITIDLICDAGTLDDLAQISMPGSPATTRSNGRSPPTSETSRAHTNLDTEPRPGTSSTDKSFGSTPSERATGSPEVLKASVTTVDTDRFADAGEDDIPPAAATDNLLDVDIRAGEDNVSWSSRRNQSGAPKEDLWNSMASEDDLPDSLLLEADVFSAEQHRLKARSTAGSSTSDLMGFSPARTPRAVSPYARSQRSPGSWPRLEESLKRSRDQQGPGSWPRLEQSIQSEGEAFTPGPAVMDDDPTDNKMAAAIRADIDLFDAHFDEKQIGAQNEDLSESRMYSHEDAESMYMSAMTGSPSINVPGGWTSDGTSSQLSISSTAAPPVPVGSTSVAESDGISNVQPLHWAPEPQDEEDLGNETPRALSPEPALSSLEGRDKSTLNEVIKQLLSIDEISLWLPSSQSVDAPQESIASVAQNERPSSVGPRVPGAFSQYSEHSSSRSRATSSTAKEDSESVLWVPQQSVRLVYENNGVDVEVGNLETRLDVSTGRLLYQLITIGLSAVRVEPDRKLEQPESSGPTAAESGPMSLHIHRCSLRFFEAFEDTTKNPALLELALTDMHLDMNPSNKEHSLQTGKLVMSMEDQELISFSKDLTLQSSRLLPDDPADLLVTLSTGQVTVQKRPVTVINIETLPICITLDLQAVDDNLSSFGGLSGIVELGNSILSDSTTAGSPPSARTKKGVRFEGDRENPRSTSELKMNARLGGSLVNLKGAACTVSLRTTAVKAVSREQGARASIDAIQLSGPHFHGQGGSSAPSLEVDMQHLRLEYFFSPRDNDLERLLALLTPSKDKYDSDDDILIETLLRQRRKGAILRATTDSVKLRISDLQCLASLQALTTEMTKLSAVTKYLPEDERPGLLSLVRMKHIECQIALSHSFGTLGLQLQDVNIAYVGLPSLLAVAVGSLRAQCVGHEDIIHSIMAVDPAENLPMVMMRMLGDEVEPTVKVKLFNTCVEYSVPIFLALAGLGPQTGPEELVINLAESIAGLALPPMAHAVPSSGSSTRTSETAPKKVNLNILLHGCALGLNPQDLAAKGLFVFSNTSFATLVPPEERFEATLELRKAALYITDDRVSAVESRVGPAHNPGSSDLDTRVLTALTSRGYVSVSSIRSANAIVHIRDSNNRQSKVVDVDLRDELFLLETCADSTQTLFAILGGLAPPTPPSKEPKYLTQPMRIEDMLASFTGDAYAKPQPPPETLFDVDEEPDEDDADFGTAFGMGDEADDLLAESEMTSSLYGPVSGLIGGLEDGDDGKASVDFGATAESLLEEDPFEMPSSPTSQQLSDSALLESLRTQCRPSVDATPLDLGMYEIEDLGLDAVPRDPSTLGSAYRFNTPASAKARPVLESGKEELPFKLCLRDFHIIWNLHDGYDWRNTRESITEAVEEVEQRIEERKAKRRRSTNDNDDEESVIEDCLFNSIYIGVPANSDAQDLRRQINRHIDDQISETESYPASGMSRPSSYSGGGRPSRAKPRRRLRLERSKHHKIAFELKGLSADVLVFAPGSGEVQSSVDVRMRDFEIFDNVPTSTWKKFLTHLHENGKGREMAKPMIHVDLATVKTMPDLAASELVLRVSILPLRLHVDQDALDFITRFFEFKDQSTTSNDGPSEQPFLQRIEIDTVDLVLDYKPKKIDYAGLRSGRSTEFMNFMILDAAKIRLNHAIVFGVRGFEPLHGILNGIWMPDVKRNQLPGILAGLAPVRSLVNIGSGVRDVIAIPVREYRKDGRIVRSIQKGAFHFAKTTTSELARLGAKVAIGTQTVLQGAEGFLSPAPSSPSGRPGLARRISSDQGWHDVEPDTDEHQQRAISAYSDQPISVMSGLRSAGRYLEHDLLTARDAFIAIQGEVMDSGSAGAAAGAVARHAPTVILRPVIGASRAVGATLLGLGNQVDRGNLRKVEDVSCAQTRVMWPQS